MVTEQLSEELKNLLVVRTADANADWVVALRQAVESDSFHKVIEDPQGPYVAFQRPDWYVAKWGAAAGSASAAGSVSATAAAAAPAH